jgi:uncharacterized protein YgiM (DUF1202 family)
MHRIIYAASAIALTIGFIGGGYAATLATPPAPQTRAYETIGDVAATIGTDSTPLRDAPRNSGNIIERLPRGTKVTATGKDPSGQWAMVTVHGKTGYVDIRALKVGAGQYQ